jgi:hypothetical protein
MKILSAIMRGHIAKYLYVYVFALLILHLITVFLSISNPEFAVSSQASLFDLDRENNVPTYSNSILLGSSAVVCIALSIKSKLKIHKLGWLLFGTLFGYLALDEALIIHEQLAEPTRRLLDIGNSNPLYHAWVVPAIFIVIFLATITYILKRYYKQLQNFAVILRYVVILAGVVVALEIIGTFVYGNTNAYRILMVPLEEIFELSMAALILDRLILQLRSNNSN